MTPPNGTPEAAPAASPSPFDEVIDRRGTHCVKWDAMEALYCVSPRGGIAMWVADMDFRPPPCVIEAVRAMADHGVFGYFGDPSRYEAALRWWHRERHGWEPGPEETFTTGGLVNGAALCVDAFSAPGEAVVLFTPVYHAFARVIRAAGREVRELPMPVEDGRYALHADALAEMERGMRGNERVLLFCSPHNPGGRCWTEPELEAVAEFARRHDLVLVSDEIHADLAMPGHRHRPMILLDGIADRLVTMTAATKTFNIAGAHVGNVFVHDPALRARLKARMAGLGISPNSFGLHMVTAAYSPEGAAWVDALCEYLDESRRLFDGRVNAIPGLRSMPLEATYLAWVSFEGTGMGPDEFTARVERGARIAANRGPTFGAGGEHWLRFNLAAPRAVVAEACDRLEAAFADLQ